MACNWQYISIDLPKCKERWITTSLYIENQIGDDFLLASNRLGNLLLYQRTAVDQFEHVDTLKHPHGNLGATVLQLLDNKSTSDVFISSAGRDGGTRLLCIDTSTSKLIAYSRRRIPVAWVEYIEKYEAQDIYLGFNDNHFVAWSEQHDFIAEIPCGGGHRCWHYFMQHGENLHLVFIQNRRVNYRKLQPFAQRSTILKLPERNKWHVKACNTAQVFAGHLVSAGEDNLIKVFSLRNAKLEEELAIDTHISNVRALKFVVDKPQILWLCTGGGRAQLCVHEVNLMFKTVRVRLNYTIRNDETETAADELYRFDPETRIMCIDTQNYYTSNLSIFMGCSDGYLRKLSVDSASYEIKEQKQLFLERCVLQTRVISCACVLAATTDGFLRFYDLQLTHELRTPLAHHASGVNALDLLVTDNRVHILTGGDDQSIAYSCLSLHDLKVLHTYQLPYLHTAQVTAVAINHENGTAYTSGVDQQVFKLNLENGEILDMKTTCVADVKGMSRLQEDQCLIYGCGLQTIIFDNKNE